MAAPTLSVTSSGATTLDLRWNSVTGAVGYDLFTWWEGAANWEPIDTGVSAGTSYTHTDLTPGRTYFYIVAAVDDNGVRGTWSEHASETVPGSSAELAAPVLTATTTLTTTVELNWTPVPDADSYDLRAWWESATGWQHIYDALSTDTSHSDTGVTAGRTYFYIIAAVDSNGELGAWSQQVRVTVPTSEAGLLQPTLSAASTLTTTVELNWTPVPRAVSYDLRTWWDGATDWQPVVDGSLTGTSHIHEGLTAGRTYFYTIAAMDTNGERGPWSQQVYAIVPKASAIPDVPEERAALVALYEATDGTNWAQNDNWLSEDSIATWYGVATDEDGRVSELVLPSNGLKGTVPALADLAELKILSLGSNQLTGTVPELSILSKLEILDLSFNQFTGSIPDLSTLTNLEWLSLTKNQFSGPLPNLSDLTKLSVLDLSSNQLTGSITDLSALTSLKDLSLSGNNLNGSIPDLSALTNLTDLYLEDNQLTGAIPDISTLTSLKKLSLSSNSLSGSIPDLSALTDLTDLHLGTNKLTGNVPDLSALINLNFLDLGHNQLTGQVPDLSALINLKWLLLGHNKLSGSIPDLSAFTNLTELSLGTNQLTGSIPNVSSLTSLTWLDFSDNQLTGQMPDPSALANLSNMDLALNSLSGSIPDLSALTKLSDLDLGSNQFSGSIPDLGALTELTKLILASNQLTGPVPNLGALTRLARLDLSANQLCLPAGYILSGLESDVAAHLTGLNLPACASTMISRASADTAAIGTR